MVISEREWKAYIGRLAKINTAAADLIKAYIKEYGFDDRRALIDYSYKVARTYGNASAAVNALMYDTIAELEGVILPPAELADLPEYADVAKSVNGTMKISLNPDLISGAIGRLVKQTGQDTMLKNALRDHAEFAWIPSGETCAFCIALGSNGWKPMSAKALKGGHAEHIHANCDCSYMVRHSSDFDVAGYDPSKYLAMYNEGSNVPYENENMSHPEDKTASTQKINGMRRMAYANVKKEAERQGLSEKQTSKLLNSSAASEINIG